LSQAKIILWQPALDQGLDDNPAIGHIPVDRILTKITSYAVTCGGFGAAMTSMGTRFYTWRFGERVGDDAFGNVYYRHKDHSLANRWVTFNGAAEASAVPPEWHAWLHRYVDDAPTASDARAAYVKPHQPNLTGSEAAYRPPGHDYKGGERAAATGDYEAWRPE
jgi:NADH:ubiquinone oxidoreductase subunit